ncbi:MAG: NAD/NADP octopine/nopaline dehydrogenase family protein [Defluviitaleaceae bacterium]|nr:NAD/NADP octopine/nopaline dehydrogenase family protein [Defluviitaleaceae bacterium]
MNITVVGGGNLGSLLSAKLSLKKDVFVTLLTSNPSNFSGYIEVIDEEKRTHFRSNKIFITNDYVAALCNADIVLCTLPSFLREDFIKKSSVYAKVGSLFGFVPGYGGVEFMVGELSKKGVVVFGLSRVPYICRLNKYGKSVTCLSEKKELFLGAIPKQSATYVADTVERLLDIKTTELSGYLAVTLTPSNPILHTTRVYSLFKDYPENINHAPLFYGDWTDYASDMLIKCDVELQNIWRKLSSCLDLNLGDVPPTLKHYEVSDGTSLTKKIQSIASFKNIKSPMIKQNSGYAPDTASRYFTEDFPFGLAIIKGIGLLANIRTDNIDTVLNWYSVLSDEHYFNDKLIGKDISKCGAPQKYGLNCLEDLVDIYK